MNKTPIYKAFLESIIDLVTSAINNPPNPEIIAEAITETYVYYREEDGEEEADLGRVREAS